MESLQWAQELVNEPKLKKIISSIQKSVEEEWKKVDEVVASNQLKVLDAFRYNNVGEEDFQSGSGYGYNDQGREKLEEIFARVFGGEKALVRPHFVSGTHTLVTALKGILRPGDKLISVTGAPYDTLQHVMGFHNDELLGKGTLAEWGVKYEELDLNNTGFPQLESLREKLSPEVKLAYIQRSPGYDAGRKSINLDDIKIIVKAIREVSPQTIIMVDNCYGEFVEPREPLECDVDIIAGSLIKNPGGAIAPSGGYVVGSNSLVSKVAASLTAPGLEGKLGAMENKRLFYMGLFYAPVLTGNAMKSSIFAAALFEQLGYEVNPKYNNRRGDIVQAIHFNNSELVQLFCRSIQNNSPVDSKYAPEPASVPGYEVPVIMAAGTFVQGSSSEFSADAPMKEPYSVFLQGGFTLHHAVIGICRSAEELLNSS